MRVLALVFAATLALQDDVDPQVRLKRIAEIYRAGDTNTALELLRNDKADRQRTAKDVVRSHGIPVGGTLPSKPTEPMWTVWLLRAAGAVHMEAALDVYERGGRNLSATVISQIEIGETVLDEVARLEEKPSDAQQWEWAVGEQALADGQFQVAREILARACDRYRHQAALLVACGTVYETFASFNVESGTVAAAVGSGVPSTADRSAPALLRFRTIRKNLLDRARNALEEASTLEPSNAEARLRFGMVLLEQDESKDAANALEAVVQSMNDRRTAYLSRLFLGRVREEQKRSDEAMLLFRQAIAVVPAQSARLALANRLHAAGRNADALALAGQVTSDRHIEDPWWSYRLGQFWLIEPTLEALRKQARSSPATQQHDAP